jgi:hypothetical protein
MQIGVDIKKYWKFDGDYGARKKTLKRHKFKNMPSHFSLYWNLLKKI